jgi:hypothetical protein
MTAALDDLAVALAAYDVEGVRSASQRLAEERQRLAQRLAQRLSQRLAPLAATQ